MEPAPQLQYPLLDSPSAEVHTWPVPSAPALPFEPARQCKKGSWCVAAFIPLQLIVIIVQIVALSSGHWLQYCFWNFGLVYGDGDDHNSQFNKSDTGFSLQREYCPYEDYSLNEPINQYCPVFCVNIWMLIVFGLLALILGVGAIVTAIIPLVLHCLALTRKLRISYMNTLMFIPANLWTLTWMMFFGGTWGLRQEQQEHQEHLETQVGCAFWLALAASLGQIFLYNFVSYGTNKAFTKTS